MSLIIKENHGPITHIEGSTVYINPKEGSIQVAGKATVDAEDIIPSEETSPVAKTPGPKRYSLFRVERGQKDDALTQIEADRLKAYLADHHLGNTPLDSSTRSKLNKVVAYFWQWWDERGLVQEEFEGAPFYRFLTEDCGIECPVDEKAFVRAIRAIIESDKRDPEIYANVASYFQK